ncbi:hypothetical protein LJC63_02755 [Ruminococcaceae bacterium OttesenSCG-928-L11]|nr:hypothetical protein [Ruminococcaceae bacterium OttesenSCG-928-L11]
MDKIRHMAHTACILLLAGILCLGLVSCMTDGAAEPEPGAAQGSGVIRVTPVAAWGTPDAEKPDAPYEHIPLPADKAPPKQQSADGTAEVIDAEIADLPNPPIPLAPEKKTEPAEQATRFTNTPDAEIPALPDVAIPLAPEAKPETEQPATRFTNTPDAEIPALPDVAIPLAPEAKPETKQPATRFTNTPDAEIPDAPYEHGPLPQVDKEAATEKVDAVLPDPILPQTAQPYREYHYYTYRITEKVRTRTESTNTYFVTVDDSDTSKVIDRDVLSMAKKIAANHTDAGRHLLNFYPAGTTLEQRGKPFALVELRAGREPVLLSFTSPNA